MGVGGLEGAVRRLAASLGATPLGDGELVERFARTGDQAAFECLVRRHGPMVMAACRRVLGNEADAEDAFQAAFLVLARKAASVRPAGGVAAWLHGVACKTASQARRADARRRAREAGAACPCQSYQEARNDLREVIDVELSRLPGKYREVVVLCDLEGMGRREAASLLGCPEGTVASRLARGRSLLAGRLGRRGLGPVLPSAATPPAVPCSLVAATIEAAGAFAAGGPVGSPGVESLAEGVIRAMWMNKLKPAVFLLVLAAVGLAAGGLAYRAKAADPAGASRKEVALKEKERPAKGAAKVADGWRLSARPGRAKVPAGEPVVLTLVLKNVGKVPLVYGEASPRDDYARKALVTDEKGQEVPLTRYGRQWKGNLPVKRFVSRTLKPGQEATATLCISRAYDLSVAGTYRVTVRHPFAYKPGESVAGLEAEVVSNTVEVTVTDP